MKHQIKTDMASQRKEALEEERQASLDRRAELAAAVGGDRQHD